MTTPPLILIAASGIYLVGLMVTAYFTRATRKRIIGALSGGVAVAVVGVAIECLAHARGWWRYPFIGTAYGPPLIYPIVVLAFAALALIGWRVTRRFGWRGQALFLSAVTMLGTLRDYRIAAWVPQLIEFAPGLGTVLVDAGCYAVLLTLAQIVMRFVSGPNRAGIEFVR
ncbi:MAG TPA: hypothetical protein VNU68_11420 [Verrucomicrobiae bacterium]|nr:hypothetical protein [Verrucomicrobiae bacterium]